MKSIPALLSALLVCLCLPACTQRERPLYFLSDRHALSYDLVQDWCGRTGCTTLVLFDQHNDVSADSSDVHSYDWVGQLVDRGCVSEVYWVCRSSADGLELAAKRRWLERNTASKDGENAKRVLEAFHIVDFQGFRKLHLKQPYAVSVDLDLYDAAEEADPTAFIRKTCAFLRTARCPLVTVSLSAAYQKSPDRAWGYLECFMREAPKAARWLFTSGGFGEQEESREDRAAFTRWKDEIALFQGYQSGFYRGAYLWLNAPPAIQELFVQKDVAAYAVDRTDGGANATETVLQAMRDRQARETELAPYAQKGELEALHRAAIGALRDSDSFTGRPPAPPEVHCAFDDARSRGIAVRYRTAEEDRGCLALYYGLDFARGDAEQAAAYASMEAAQDPRYPFIRSEELDGLFINLSIFSCWEAMDGWDDFVPGLDSLLLVNPEAESPGLRETLLQASLASERGYTKEAFLRRLSLKAGLGADGYAAPSLRFYRAKTVSYTAKAVQ